MRSGAVNTLGTAGMVSLGGSAGDASFARTAGPGIIKAVAVTNQAITRYKKSKEK
jgi:hypothetical protein